MKMKTLFASVCMAIILSGCAAPEAIDTQSGFLSDYSKLQTSKTDENAAVYLAEGYDPKNYKNIEFAPVQVQLADVLTEDANVDAEQQKQLAEYVASELDKALSQGFVGKGEGTLHIRSAISGISSNSENLAVYQYIPVALVATAALEAGGKRDKELVLFFEAEAIDKASGEVVAAKVAAAELGTAATSALEEDPIKAIEPKLSEWIEQLVAEINQKMQ